MPLDPSIILGAGKDITPLQNPMDVAGKALNYQNLAMQNTQARQQFNDEQAMRNAYAQNTKVDENGNPSIDRQGMLKSLASTSPSSVLKFQQDMQSMDYNMQKQRLEKQIQDLNFGARTLLGVNDQASYENALKTAQAAGHDVSHFPKLFDPNFVNSQIAKGMDAKDYLTTQTAKLEAENKSKELALAMNKQYGVPIPKNISPDTKPSTLIKNAPQHLQEPITKEVGLAESTAFYLPKLIKAMDEAHDKIESGIYTRESYNDAINAIKVLAAPLVKDVQGGNKQAAVDAFVESIKPENKDKLTGGYGTKRQAAIDFGMGNMKAPASEAAGINLNNFKSTRIDPELLKNPDHYQPTPQEAAAELARRRQARTAGR